ncbi:MAG: hypothetical protein R3E87_19325 [Burkholderiaceae bacterium]
MLDTITRPPIDVCPPIDSDRRRLLIAIAGGVALAGCAATGDHAFQSGPLARVTPKDFASYDPAHIAAGIDIDSRVPAELNRGIELVAGVMPVDHDAWQPVGARLPMRPMMLLGDKPDVAAGKPMHAWAESPAGGRLRLAYVLTDDGREEMRRLQGKFSDLLARHPPSSGHRGALRLRVDMYRMLPPNVASFASSRLQNWLQLSLAEGPVLIWDGRVGDMR